MIITPKRGRSMTQTLASLFRKQKDVAGLVLHDEGYLDSDTILVHFTSPAAAEAIVREGFKFGVTDIEDLGMTKGVATSEPGFNYAFVGTDYPDLWSDTYSTDFMVGETGEDDRYGVVIFRSEAVHNYHWDDMWQAIFWGPDVKLDRMMAFTAVKDQNGNMTLTSLDGRYQGNMGKAISLADRALPRSKVLNESKLPWPDFQGKFYNPDNLKRKINPYLPLASHRPKSGPTALEAIAKRTNILALLAETGVDVGDRLEQSFGALRWELRSKPGFDVALEVIVDRVGVSLTICPTGRGSGHPDAVIADLPENMDPEKVREAISTLVEKADLTVEREAANEVGFGSRRM